MPTYQYACTACDHRFEAVQAFSDEPLTTCPECTGRLRKVFSAVGVVFKGSGFYRTDSRARPTDGAGPDRGKDTPATDGAAGKGGSGKRGAGKGATTEGAGTPAGASKAGGSNGRPATGTGSAGSSGSATRSATTAA